MSNSTSFVWHFNHLTVELTFHVIKPIVRHKLHFGPFQDIFDAYWAIVEVSIFVKCCYYEQKLAHLTLAFETKTKWVLISIVLAAKEIKEFQAYDCMAMHCLSFILIQHTKPVIQTECDFDRECKRKQMELKSNFQLCRVFCFPCHAA